MPSTPTLPAARFARFPGTALAKRSGGPNLARRGGDSGAPIGPVDYDSLDGSLRDQLEVDSHLEPASDTALLAANPTTPSTIAIYRLNLGAGACRVAGVYARFAAAADQTFLDGAPDIPSYQLDGSAAVALTADGQTYWFALVALLVSGAVELHGVFGDEAADTAEVQLTAQQIRDALEAAAIANADLDALLVLSRIKVQRVAVDTITLTHTDPATDDALAAERGRGYSLEASPS